MVGQIGFWDTEHRLAELSAEGDCLVYFREISSANRWRRFTPACFPHASPETLAPVSPWPKTAKTPWFPKGFSWCCRKESNLRPYPYQGYALPTELRQHLQVVGGCPVKRGALCQSFSPWSSAFVGALDQKGKVARIAAMNDTQSPAKDGTKAGAQAEARRRRQAEALRANLARRKAQDRARTDEALLPTQDEEVSEKV